MTYKVNAAAAAMGLAAVILFLSAPVCRAQDRDQDRDRDRDRDQNGYWDQGRQMYTRLDRGTVVPVRILEAIDVERSDDRVYPGIVDQDVRGENGRLAIPRGANVEVIVRVAPDNDLILDLESVSVNGQRYGIAAVANRVESVPDRSVIGAIVGAVNGGYVRGRAVRVPRDSVVTFRLDRPLMMGVADRGVDREGRHYHDYWRDRDDRR